MPAPTPRSPDRRRPVTPLLLLVLAAALAVFLPGLTGDFVYDDQILIVENEALAQLQPGVWLRSGLWDGTPTPNEPPIYYRPLVVASLAVDRAFFGLRPGPFRLHSLLWHLVSVGALLALLRRLDLGPPALLAAGLVFAVHPAQVEAVSFVASRNDLMAAALVLLGVLALDRDRPGPAGLGLGFLAMLGAILSKESAVLAPLVFAALAWARTGRPGRLSAHLSVLLALGAGLGLRAWAGIGSPPQAGPATLLDALLPTAAWYGRVLTWPVGLAPGMHLRWAGSPSAAGLAAGFVLAVGTLALGGRRAAAGWLVAVLTAAPALAAVAHTGLVPDRYLYLPLAGIALAVGAAVQRLPRRAGLAVATPLGLGLTLLAGRTVPTWADDATLWRTAVAAHPNPHSFGAYAKVLEQAGALEEAAAFYREATTTRPPLRHACWNVAAIGIKRGDPAAAAADGEAALAHGCPPDPELLAPTALGHALTGSWDAAEARAAQVDQDPTGKAVLVRVAAAARRGDLGPFDAAAPSPAQARQLGAMVARVLRDAGEVEVAARVEAHAGIAPR